MHRARRRSPRRGPERGRLAGPLARTRGAGPARWRSRGSRGAPARRRGGGAGPRPGAPGRRGDPSARAGGDGPEPSAGEHAPRRAEGGRERLSALRAARDPARATARRAARRRWRRGRGGRPRPARARARRHAHHWRREPHRDRRPRKGAGSLGVALHAGAASPHERAEPRGDRPGPTRQPRPISHPRAPAGRARAARGARSAEGGDGRPRRARLDLQRGAARATPLLRPAHHLSSPGRGHEPARRRHRRGGRGARVPRAEGRDDRDPALPGGQREDADGRLPGPGARARSPWEPRGISPRNGGPAPARAAPQAVRPLRARGASRARGGGDRAPGRVPGDAPLRALAAPLGPRGSAGDSAAPPGRRGPRAAPPAVGDCRRRGRRAGRARALAGGPAACRRHLPGRGGGRAAASRPRRVGDAAACRMAPAAALARVASRPPRPDPAGEPDDRRDRGARHRCHAPHRRGAPRAGAHAPARPRAAA